MTDYNIINLNLIDFNPSGRTKSGVIRGMTEMLLEAGRIHNSQAFIKNILEREVISSTDTGIGVAIPHGKGSFVLESSVAVCRFDEGLIWDKDPVKAVFMLAVDDDEEGLAHLELIAKISTMLMDDDFLELLFNAVSEDILLKDIYRRLEEDDF
jgi:fructose-specific phosphotransferase system IIA component